jgi:hypothetical protein
VVRVLGAHDVTVYEAREVATRGSSPDDDRQDKGQPQISQRLALDKGRRKPASRCTAGTTVAVAVMGDVRQWRTSRETPKMQREPAHIVLRRTRMSARGVIEHASVWPGNGDGMAGISDRGEECSLSAKACSRPTRRDRPRRGRRSGTEQSSLARNEDVVRDHSELQILTRLRSGRTPPMIDRFRHRGTIGDATVSARGRVTNEDHATRRHRSAGGKLRRHNANGGGRQRGAADCSESLNAADELDTTGPLRNSDDIQRTRL